MQLNDEEIATLLRRAALPHMSGEEMALYYDGGGDAFTRARIESHFKLCLICSRSYESLQSDLAGSFEASQPGALNAKPALASPGRPPLADLIRSAIGVVLVAALNKFTMRARSYAVSAADKDTKIDDGQTENGFLQWRIIDDRSTGEMVVRMSANRIDLEGYGVALRVGPSLKEVRFNRVKDDEVSTRLLVSPEEREQLPADARIIIEGIVPPV